MYLVILDRMCIFAVVMSCQADGCGWLSRLLAERSKTAAGTCNPSYYDGQDLLLGGNLGSWSSRLGCFSFLPDFDSRSVHGPGSLIQVLIPKLLHIVHMERYKAHSLLLLLQFPYQFLLGTFCFQSPAITSRHGTSWCCSFNLGGSFQLLLWLLFSLTQSYLLSVSSISHTFKP